METSLLAFGLRHKLKPNELIAFEMLRKFSKEYDSVKNYESSIFRPSAEDFRSLIEKGIVISSSSNPDLVSCIVNPQIRNIELETNEDMAQELWDNYPAALPLGNGGMFIARKGPDKHEVLKLYLERINFSPEKHRFVLDQLKVYVKLVLDQKINGHRIHDWISNEMWDIVPSLLSASRGEFKTDI
jgi:hypothetical protein